MMTDTDSAGEPPWGRPGAAEALYDTPYLREQLITYIGNKRALLAFIGGALETVRSRLGRANLVTADLFSGSGVVARLLKLFSHRLIANDQEYYSRLINECYLSNGTDRDERELRRLHREITNRLIRDEQAGSLLEGPVTRSYAPRDDDAIKPGERVFYTRRNARYIDTARAYIEEVSEELRVFFLAPLLAMASVHANTAGVFKGFYKDRRTGVGRFGGTGNDALTRIRRDIHLPFPIFSPRDCSFAVYQEDANSLAPVLAEREGTVDLVYLDPPYNQHPYGSNYFMLNLIALNRVPENVSSVSGIPADWNRSAYNSTLHAGEAFSRLIHDLRARFLLISFNSEGFLSRETVVEILSAVGRVEVMETPYNTFRGSRNLRNRAVHVREYLFLVDAR
jgi:adenine-specific DNA-methyltransferase